ncbi:MAG: TatD family hydrolase [Deltaproteobacteria bacterium]|nr:TatD family hydrolase [Deltaproteobacteria bacterium]
MTFIDTHAHLQWPDYKEDLPNIFERAKEAGVQKMVVVGTHITNMDETLCVAESKKFLYAALGIHPHDVKDLKEGDLETLEKKAHHKKVVAIGEIGLDYYYEHSPQDLQKEYFKKQIKIAQKLKKPIIVHSREAEEDTYKISKEVDASHNGGVMHCFTGSLPFALQMIELGFYISFTGIITFKKKVEALQNVVKNIPLESMVLETDCPYLTPEPYRGKRNEPSYVRFTAEKIAELKGVSLEEVGKITTENATKLFGLG